jgi:hypothetical protein
MEPAAAATTSAAAASPRSPVVTQLPAPRGFLARVASPVDVMSASAVHSRDPIDVDWIAGCVLLRRSAANHPVFIENLLSFFALLSCSSVRNFARIVVPLLSSCKVLHAVCVCMCVCVCVCVLLPVLMCIYVAVLALL